MVDGETSHIVYKEKNQPEDLAVSPEGMEPSGEHASWSGVFQRLEGGRAP